MMDEGFNGPPILELPLDFLARFIRGCILWPLAAVLSLVLVSPFVLLLCDVENPDDTDRLVGKIFVGFAVFLFAPALAMAQAFHQRGQATPWGSGGGRPPEDPPDFPKPPEPSSPAVDIDDPADEDNFPDPEWFRQTAPADLREKEMNR